MHLLTVGQIRGPRLFITLIGMSLDLLFSRSLIIPKTSSSVLMDKNGFDDINFEKDSAYLGRGDLLFEGTFI